ncbi:Zn-dependent protease [Candidatus Symbiobacter mobilis CR]|uniref:Zn-dependent protease n=2 Tax=Candidatus Symbiobacter TaxID=1436289 RepID=U5ND14_9BURK|nr:Zn-dependent protease [Candidatus Symbiobacter mobilis CR]
MLRALALAPLLSASGIVLGREGIDVGQTSMFARLIPAEQIEKVAALQYRQMLQQAAAAKKLAPAEHPSVRRLRSIAGSFLRHTVGWNPRAKDWKWEVHLIQSKEINAFCMPGGKIVFFSAILDTLRLSDDETATVMGHEMAHALREHARERLGKSTATSLGVSLLGQVLGLGDLGRELTNLGAKLLTLQFSRSDESEADLVGMELAARAGFDPRAGISLWQKMAAASKGAPPQWLSTHPSNDARIGDIRASLPKVLPLYRPASSATGRP